MNLAHVPCNYVHNVHRKTMVGQNWQIWRIVSHSPKLSSQIFTNTRKTYYGIGTDCSLFTKFFLANSFYLHGLPKFSATKYFSCTVHTYMDTGGNFSVVNEWQTKFTPKCTTHMYDTHAYHTTVYNTYCSIWDGPLITNGLPLSRA